MATYEYNVRNEIERMERPGEVAAEQVVRYLYDDNGNRIEKGYDVGDDGDIDVTLATYEYDTSNRLTSVDVDGADAFEAAYDYRTRRVSKTTYPGGTAETTTFRYDGGVSFDELKGGVKQVEFVRGSGMGGGIGSILYSDRTASGGEKEYFVYSPAVGHTVATLTGDTGAVAVKSTNLYEAFGNVVKLNVNTWEQTDGPTSGASDNNRLANTKERDASIGLDNHGFRYYDPEIGRYTTRDPIGYGDGMNVYLSVHNNPINHFDPLGLCETCGKHEKPDPKPEPKPEQPGPEGKTLNPQVKKKLDEAWTSSKHATTEPREHIGLLRGDPTEPEGRALDFKRGEESSASVSISVDDDLSGVYHTHPYGKATIDRVPAFAEQGSAPSPQDLASQLGAQPSGEYGLVRAAGDTVYLTVRRKPSLHSEGFANKVVKEAHTRYPSFAPETMEKSAAYMADRLGMELYKRTGGGAFTRLRREYKGIRRGGWSDEVDQ